MTENEDRREIIRYAISLGYAVADERARHLKFVHSKVFGPVFINPHSHDPRSMRNARKLLDRKLREVA